ncbi:MAG: TlpA family protein disulfide reductase [Actinomycetia bacterium]|nr:TlpA family protein disulfide reductase [Actinomycetes bacterium]
MEGHPNKPKVSPRAVFLSVAVMAIAVIVGSILFAGDGDPPADTMSLVPQNVGNEGERVPTDSFTMFDGSTATFADFAGKPLVVNFFASWCSPCRAEMPHFQTVHEDLGDEVTFLGLASGDRVEDARALVEETGVTFTVASDPGEFLIHFGGIAMPTTALVSADGVIVDMFTGPLDEERLRDRIAEHLGVSS